MTKIRVAYRQRYADNYDDIFRKPKLAAKLDGAPVEFILTTLPKAVKAAAEGQPGFIACPIPVN